MTEEPEETIEPVEVEEEGTSLEIVQLAEELRAEKSKNLRLMAEAENARKRMQKERSETIKFSVANALADLLAPLDNFENALGFAGQASEETKMWAQGFEMIATQFRDALAAHNITPFHAGEGPFDPHLHEALETEERDDIPAGTITHEFAKGYKCGERILRPARVKVVRAQATHQTEEEEPDNEQPEEK